MKKLRYEIKIDEDEFDYFCGGEEEYLPPTYFELEEDEDGWVIVDSDHFDYVEECIDNTPAESWEKLVRRIEEVFKGDGVIESFKLLEVEEV